MGHSSQQNLSFMPPNNPFLSFENFFWLLFRIFSQVTKKVKQSHFWTHKTIFFFPNCDPFINHNTAFSLSTYSSSLLFFWLLLWTSHYDQIFCPFNIMCIKCNNNSMVSTLDYWVVNNSCKNQWERYMKSRSTIGMETGVEKGLHSNLLVYIYVRYN